MKFPDNSFPDDARRSCPQSSAYLCQSQVANDHLPLFARRVHVSQIRLTVTTAKPSRINTGHIADHKKHNNPCFVNRNTRAAVGIESKPPYRRKNLWKSPRNPHTKWFTQRTLKPSINIPQTLPLFVRCIFCCLLCRPMLSVVANPKICLKGGGLRLHYRKCAQRNICLLHEK